ncbi:thiamine phosphate synthase [Pilimelia columellifera]|uniref:Thiamine phosphate synthase n=1 Tax=Pilimelia columellifera subsp. columellifera TaxID=706583 RepID=A0ABN3NEB8_9ACTN
MSLWVLTDRRQAVRPLVEVVCAAVAAGAGTVLLRERDLPRGERVKLVERLRAVIPPGQARLVVAGADPLGGDAVHLSAAETAPVGLSLVGRSCHDAVDLAALASDWPGPPAVDYAFVSPVYATESKPGYGPPVGVAGLAALVRIAPVPVVALGGISAPAQVTECLSAGAVAVAVMGAIMRADDPGAVVAEMLTAARAVVPDGRLGDVAELTGARARLAGSGLAAALAGPAVGR